MNIPDLPRFAHKVNGRWYFSSNETNFQEYVLKCKEAYGTLRGVTCCIARIDYDAVVWIGEHGYPCKNHRYI